MDVKKDVGSAEWIDPDDEPELTEEMLEDAELFHGDTFIKRLGRPVPEGERELIRFWLDPDVLAKLREFGPGWQSQIDPLLRRSLGLPPR